MNKTLLILIILSLSTLPLIACDMFMLQSINNYPFLTSRDNPGNFNDPYDFFENFKSQANQTSGNRDGYGIIAYAMDNPLVDRDYSWYKTGIGNYFDVNNLDEPFYEAISVLYNNPDISRVLVHARSGTGGEGNHPFIFSANDRSYTFMHNGYIFNSVKNEVINYLGEDWFNDHPSQWEGDFNSPNTFIDSEVIFHYLMSYVLQYPNDIPTAFRHAFNNKRVGNIDLEFYFKYNNNTVINFIFSDGTDTYAYRSSEIYGLNYNLSYQVYPEKFVAVATKNNLANTMIRNQLIKISPQGEVIDLSIKAILQTNFINKFVETIDLNLYKLSWKIQKNNQISQFNIFRALNQNFSNAQQISSILVDNHNQTEYYYFDNFVSSNPLHYYWLEIVFNDGSSELTSNIPSTGSEDEPDITEIVPKITLYPNPFKEKLNISVETKEDYTIKMFNLKGQLVDQLSYQPGTKETLIWDTAKINNLKVPNGIYILQFISGNNTTTRKIMRIK